MSWQLLICTSFTHIYSHDRCTIKTVVCDAYVCIYYRFLYMQLATYLPVLRFHKDHKATETMFLMKFILFYHWRVCMQSVRHLTPHHASEKLHHRLVKIKDAGVDDCHRADRDHCLYSASIIWVQPTQLKGTPWILDSNKAYNTYSTCTEYIGIF